MIRVEVTETDIREGIAGDCFRCAVSLGLERATKDDHANVYERDYLIWLEVWSRSILAPSEVADFVRRFDRQPRQTGGRLATGHRKCEALESFAFELPDQDDPEWKERCYGCEQLCDQKELDDEGYCHECKENL